MRHVSMFAVLVCSCATPLGGGAGGFPEALTHPVKLVVRKEHLQAAR
jgi:hypothetical protein